VTAAVHPRLSVSEMCTFPWSFADELALWGDLGLHHVGVMANKLDAHGRQAAVAELRQRSLATTTVISGNFDLSAPATWDARRAEISGAIDLAAELGGCVYITPGRRDGRSFDELTASLADAAAPCLAHAASRGVRLAIEPSLRTDVSYVHTLRDAIDVCDATGLSLIADLGNCWAERDYEATVRRAGSRIAAVQFADAVWGRPGEGPPGGRAVPGDGDLAISTFLGAAVDAGYTGAFELEMVGPLVEAEGHESAVRRAVERAGKLLEEVLS
jgi:sugar phosphate isomerase/epimerase